MPRPDYTQARASFRWDDAFQALNWTATGDVSLGTTILDRHAGRHDPAFRWLGRDGSARVWTFDELSELSSRVANLLRRLGVGKGDRVAGYLPRIPETIATIVGTWKAGAVYVPIFTGFGPDAIAFRVGHSGAKVLVTQRDHRAQVPRPLPGDVVVVTVGGGASAAGDLDFASAVAAESSHCTVVPCRRRDPAVLLYTSGSTGLPKGVQIATNFVLAVHPYMRYGVDLRVDDVFWPTGDPAWGYGLVCYMVALALGVAVVSHEATPVPELCLARLHELGVTTLATTPTLLRGIMALGRDAVGRRPSRLRSVSSCGEPLNAEVVRFFDETWGLTVMDHYGASELGLPIGNCNALQMPVKPGSMGRPLPGSRMAVVDDDGREVEPDVVGHIGMAPGGEGYYALGYWDDPARTRELLRGAWITIGDLARRDADGYFWFAGRADDVIKSAGYRIGPFEVESALLQHPAVAEAAVVGKPDALRGQIVKAFVVLREDVLPRAGLTDEIAAAVRRRLGRHQCPREIELVDRLPKTETGKIQRFLLRGR